MGPFVLSKHKDKISLSYPVESSPLVSTFSSEFGLILIMAVQGRLQNYRDKFARGLGLEKRQKVVKSNAFLMDQSINTILYLLSNHSE